MLIDKFWHVRLAFERLGNVYDFMRWHHSFLGKTKILKKSFDIFKKQYTEPVIIGITK
jgi:hypothetical protein